MSQLISPSQALTQAFVLPKVSADPGRPSAAAQARSSVVAGYGVRVGNIGLLLPNGVASRLVEMEDIHICRLPTAPSWLLGMANLDGNTVPMFDLEQLLGLSREAPTTKFLIIGSGEAAAGITLSGRPERVRWSSEQKMTRNPPLPEMMQAHVKNCYRSDKVWVELDFEAFFQASGAQL